MKQSVRADTEKFQRELNIYRSTLVELYKERHTQPSSLLDRQITFWMESARFLISELEIWGKLGNETKYALTLNKVQQTFDYLNGLIAQLSELDHDGFDTYDGDE